MLDDPGQNAACGFEADSFLLHRRIRDLRERELCRWYILRIASVQNVLLVGDHAEDVDHRRLDLWRRDLEAHTHADLRRHPDHFGANLQRGAVQREAKLYLGAARQRLVGLDVAAGTADLAHGPPAGALPALIDLDCAGAGIPR